MCPKLFHCQGLTETRDDVVIVLREDLWWTSNPPPLFLTRRASNGPSPSCTVFVSYVAGSEGVPLSCTSLRPHSGGSGDRACTRAGTIRYRRNSVMLWIQILGCSVPYRPTAVWPAWVIETPRGLAGGPNARRFHGYIWVAVQDGSWPHW